jgi:EAL domain-containing protein (putative c-di-GMP-specific phosphodiesterase class I)
MKLIGYLRNAIDKDELQLYYQPKIDPKLKKVIGMEALIRWVSPELGFIAPADFIPLAEETGLIVPIGEWVLNEACRQTKAWQKDGFDDLTISVNVSSEQFRHQDLSQVVHNALKSSGLEPGFLVLELTESMVMANPEKTIVSLQQLKKQGLAISIDDFGTGYSSLSYLKKFPLDELKIDRSFIMDVDNDTDDKAIVTAIIAMSHSLSLKIVAEGVESEPQLNLLTTLDCDQIQGFYFSKPLPKEEFPLFVTNMNKPKIE